MTHSRIRILPIENPAPQMASLPLENARHWISSFEENGNVAPIFVFLSQKAYIRAVVHASSELEFEVGGVLVGKWCVDPDTKRHFITINASLPARFTQQGSVFLTFTQDSLVDIHAKIDEEYPDNVIVGWYHTHPRMGVFLSQYDTWLHDHFFPEAWQVALVIEPHTRVGGFFIRRTDGVLDPDQYFGFYELDENAGQSIIVWNNLEQSSVEIENQGEDNYE